MNVKKLDTIQKLLAKAESTTPEEAEALTEAAEKMMVRYGIDRAMLDASKPKTEREPIIQATVDFTGRYRQGVLIMATLALNGFGTMRTLRRSGAKHERLYIIGAESDVELAQILVRSLELQAIAAMSVWWKRWRKNNPGSMAWAPESEKFRMRRQFVISFGQGAGDRIASEHAKDVSERGTGTELVLADRKALADAWVDEQYPKLRKGRGLAGGGEAARESGRSAGRTANVGTTALGGPRAQIAN